MSVHMECAKCTNTVTVADSPTGTAVLCPNCQQPMSARSALPATNILVAEPRTESQGLRFDIESAIALGVFALLLVSAVLFYMRF